MRCRVHGELVLGEKGRASPVNLVLASVTPCEGTVDSEWSPGADESVDSVHAAIKWKNVERVISSAIFVLHLDGVVGKDLEQHDRGIVIETSSEILESV